MSIDFLAALATAIGAPIGVGAIIYAALQLSRSARTNQGQFLLELERMSAAHDDIHIKLRPGGTWESSRSGPENAEEWAKVEDYMGFFEHCEILMKKRSLSPSDFRDIFGYRVHNIMANRHIVEAKLIKEQKHWILFLGLLKRLGIRC